MCGINGIFLTYPGSQDIPSSLGRMNEALRARGPDSAGQWGDASVGIGLGHTRLAILDTSPRGNQPMESADGRYILVYNGEVYNYRDIADSALTKSCSFRGSSDSEVILECISQIGLDRAVRLFNGMFAFGLWDREERALFLVRDRVGVKPLYYGWNRHGFVFASELKAIRAISPELQMNEAVLPGYCRHGYITGSETIYRDVYRLEPGTCLRIDNPGRRSPTITKYWSVAEVAKRGLASIDTRSCEEITETLHTLLLNSVSLRMISDVPIGAFLSGGIDSSLVVALMQRLSSVPVKTFTIGFHGQECNEAPYAASVAKHLGTDHTELYMGDTDVLNIVPTLTAIYDEPFGDSSQIPTSLLSQLTRKYVTVSLSGDGGDELFCGYPRYHVTAAYAPLLSRLTRAPRRLLSELLAVLEKPLMKVHKGLARGFPSGSTIRMHSESLMKLRHVLRAPDAWGLYEVAITQWFDEEGLLRTASDNRRVDDPGGEMGLFERMMLYDQMTYLTDDILTKVDRASMSASLESREPLLDPRVIEYAWRIPLSLKTRGSISKIILRDILSRYVPRELFERPKLGFGAPIGDWLRTILRDWAEDLLNPVRMDADGIFNTRLVQRKWREHLQGEVNWQYPLWYVLMFQDWYRTVWGGVLDR